MFHGTANSMSYRCVSMQIYVDCHSNIKAKLSNTCAISFFLINLPSETKDR